MKPNEPQPDAPLSFEQALAKLEAIVAALEEGDAALTESLAHYEQGVNLLRQCHEMLQRAERKIELLTGADAAGNPLTQPFDATATFSADEPAPARRRRASE
jgi:exodeoxyribonuclease VII small subunit